MRRFGAARRRLHSSLDGSTPDQTYFNQPPFRLAV